MKYFPRTRHFFLLLVLKESHSDILFTLIIYDKLIKEFSTLKLNHYSLLLIYGFANVNEFFLMLLNYSTLREKLLWRSYTTDSWTIFFRQAALGNYRKKFSISCKHVCKNCNIVNCIMHGLTYSQFSSEC